MPENSSPEGNPGWTPEPVAQEEPRTAISRIIEILSWVALVGIVSAVAIPAFAGHPIDDKGILSTLLGFVGLPFLIARMRRASFPWLYSLAGLGLFFAIPLAAGAMRGLENRKQGNELIAAIEAFEPETGKQARAAEQAKDALRLKSILVPAIRRAGLRAPDEELVAYSEAMFRLVDTPTGVDRQRCLELTSGAAQTRKSAEEEIQIAQANTRLFLAAAKNPEPVGFDMGRSVALRGDYLKAVDRDGLLADPARLQAMTSGEKCDFYLRMIRGLHELPLPDAALILRGNFTTP